jgi:hypothetical protein
MYNSGSVINREQATALDAITCSLLITEPELYIAVPAAAVSKHLRGEVIKSLPFLPIFEG